MNIANKITITRIFMVPIFMVLYYSQNSTVRFGAVIIFILASISDTLDGYIARKYNQITNFGKFVDPLADKLLVTSALIILVDISRMPSWICVIILAREFMVTALRTVAADRGKVIAASNLGKIKTVVQMIGLIIMLALSPYYFISGVLSSDTIINFAILIITLWSGIDYIYKNYDLIKQAE